MISRQGKKAYVFRKADRSGSWVTGGKEIVGWKVQSIDRGGATLRKDVAISNYRSTFSNDERTRPARKQAEPSRSTLRGPSPSRA